MASNVKITFVNGVSKSETLNIKINTGVVITSLNEIFTLVRTKKGQIEAPSATELLPITTSANNYKNGWNLDYSTFGGLGNLIATIDGDVVTINLNNASWQFEEVSGTVFDNNKATFVINNDIIQDSKELIITDYTKNTQNPCYTVDANLEAKGGNNIYNVYLNSSLYLSNQSSNFNVTVDRSSQSLIRVIDTSGSLIKEVTTISNRKLISEDIKVSVVNLNTGITLTISPTYISSYVSAYQYSLDGITYQSSNTYTGLTPNTYTIYVKDAFDCVTEKQLVVDGSTEVTETNFYISEINALRFAKVDNNKKNHKNTLSFDELRLNKYPYFQQFTKNKVIPTQFKTNAQYINCFKLNKQGVKSTLTPIKKTENIGLYAKSTGTYFDLGNGKSGVYFGVVDLLDYTTELVEESVNYGFALPQWANKKGNYVTISDVGQIAIDKISYSDKYNSFILEFKTSFDGGSANRIISAEYNLQNYEIYEFDTSVTEDCNVVIQVGASSEVIESTCISECIQVVEDSDFLYEITYWDDKNKGGMNYQTGIKHTLRLFGYQDDVGEQETQGYNGDNEYYVTDNIIYDVQKFSFPRLSTQIANKLRLVFTHKYLNINGLFYKIAEAPEIKGESSYNMKSLSVNLKHGGEKFLLNENENITNTSINQAVFGGVESAKGKGLILWTK